MTWWRWPPSDPKPLKVDGKIAVSENCCCLPCNTGRCDCGVGDFVTGEPCRLPDEILIRKKVGDFKACGDPCFDQVDDDWDALGGAIGGPGIALAKIDQCCTFNRAAVTGCPGILSPVTVTLTASCEDIAGVCGIKLTFQFEDGIWEGHPINPADGMNWQTLDLVVARAICNSPTELEVLMNWPPAAAAAGRSAGAMAASPASPRPAAKQPTPVPCPECRSIRTRRLPDAGGSYKCQQCGHAWQKPRVKLGRRR